MVDGALPAKFKELIALAIAATRGCDGCIAAHARGVARQEASEAEVAEAMGCRPHEWRARDRLGPARWRRIASSRSPA